MEFRAVTFVSDTVAFVVNKYEIESKVAADRRNWKLRLYKSRQINVLREAPSEVFFDRAFAGWVEIDKCHAALPLMFLSRCNLFLSQGNSGNNSYWATYPQLRECMPLISGDYLRFLWREQVFEEMENR